MATPEQTPPEIPPLIILTQEGERPYDSFGTIQPGPVLPERKPEATLEPLSTKRRKKARRGPRRQTSQ